MIPKRLGPDPGNNVEAPKKAEPQEPVAPKADHTGVAVHQKETLGEILPGWTITRPTRTRGLKAKGKGKGKGSFTKPDLGMDESTVDRSHDKNIGGFKESTEITGRGDGLDGLHDIRSDDELLGSDDEGDAARRAPAHLGSEGTAGDEGTIAGGDTTFKVYKRRWFGLVQLVLLNIIVSWNVSSLVVQPTASQPR